MCFVLGLWLCFVFCGYVFVFCLYLVYSRVLVAEARLVKRHQELFQCWTQTVPTISKDLSLVEVEPSLMLVASYWLEEEKMLEL